MNAVYRILLIIIHAVQRIAQLVAVPNIIHIMVIFVALHMFTIHIRVELSAANHIFVG
jgi:hypothetical protein